MKSHHYLIFIIFILSFECFSKNKNIQLESKSVDREIIEIFLHNYHYFSKLNSFKVEQIYTTQTINDSDTYIASRLLNLTFSKNKNDTLLGFDLLINDCDYLFKYFDDNSLGYLKTNVDFTSFKVDSSYILNRLFSTKFKPFINTLKYNYFLDELIMSDLLLYKDSSSCKICNAFIVKDYNYYDSTCLFFDNETLLFTKMTSYIKHNDEIRNITSDYFNFVPNIEIDSSTFNFDTTLVKKNIVNKTANLQNNNYLNDSTISNLLFKNTENYKLFFFWGTWCGACKLALPYLDSLSLNKKLKIIGLNCKENDTLRLNKFLNKKKLKFETMKDSDDIATKFDLDGYPTFIMFDNKNNIILRENGYSNEVIEKIKTLLK